METLNDINTNGFNITVTARIDNDSILKLMLMFVVLIVIFLIAKRLFGA